MLRIDSSKQKNDEMKKFLPPSILFVVFPALLSILGVLTLARIPWLIGAYNYLQGAPSPIDQSSLALLGSDSTRIIILTSAIIGIACGLYLTRFATTILDATRKEGETEISERKFYALFSWWMFFAFPVQLIGLLDRIINGSPTSRFLSDIGWFLLAGAFLAFSIPVIAKYAQLVLSASLTNSQVILVGHQSGGRFKKRFEDITLRVIYEGPDP